MLFVAWGVFSMLVGFLAASRGRNGFGWCLLALLISPLLAGIIVLIQKPHLRQIEADQVAAGDMRKCPMCAELIRPEAIKCRYCSSDVPALPRRSADEEAQLRYGG